MIQIGQILRHNFVDNLYFIEYKVLKIQEVKVTTGMHKWQLPNLDKLLCNHKVLDGGVIVFKCAPQCIPSNHQDTFVLLEIVTSCMPDPHLQHKVGYQFTIPLLITEFFNY